MNARWLDKRLAKCPPASWREETRIIEDFNRIRAIVDRKREGRRGLREAQARLAPRVIDYHREAKPVTTQGTEAQDGGDDGGGSEDGGDESPGDEPPQVGALFRCLGREKALLENIRHNLDALLSLGGCSR